MNGTQRLHDHPELLEQLRYGWVLRSAICDAMKMKRGVSTALIYWAKNAQNVVERRNKGQSGKLLYHLRDAAIGEEDGTLWDLVEARA